MCVASDSKTLSPHQPELTRSSQLTPSTLTHTHMPCTAWPPFPPLLDASLASFLQQPWVSPCFLLASCPAHSLSPRPDPHTPSPPTPPTQSSSSTARWCPTRTHGLSKHAVVRRLRRPPPFPPPLPISTSGGPLPRSTTVGRTTTTTTATAAATAVAGASFKGRPTPWAAVL